MKVQIYSQWMEEVYIPVRVKQFTKAAKLVGKSSFVQYYKQNVKAVSIQGERQAVAGWLDARKRMGENADEHAA